MKMKSFKPASVGLLAILLSLPLVLREACVSKVVVFGVDEVETVVGRATRRMGDILVGKFRRWFAEVADKAAITAAPQAIKAAEVHSEVELAKGKAVLEAFKEAAEIMGKAATDIPESVTHLTSPENVARIQECGYINGKNGIWGLNGGKVPKSNLTKNIVTQVPGDLSAGVTITGDAVKAFSKSPNWGPFTRFRNRCGVMSAPPGVIDLKTMTYIAGWVLDGGQLRPTTLMEELNYTLHKLVLDFGIDAMIFFNFFIAEDEDHHDSRSSADPDCQLSMGGEQLALAA